MLRKLQKKDADLMLEWMNDPDINQFFSFAGKQTTKVSVLEFIAEAQDFSEDRHYAVQDEFGEYLGTISLKNIDVKNKNAEYAICLRKKCIGTGVAKDATLELLKIAFEELALEKVYLNVFADNIRAIKFYKKIGFVHEGTSKKHRYRAGRLVDLEWFAIFKDYINE